MTEPVFIGPFRLEMQDFISLKRSVGYKYNSEPGILSRFDKYLAVNHPQADALSKEAVTGWCSKTMHETAANHCSRASVIRQFSKYLSSIGIRAWILPKNYYPTGQQYVPHIYTPDELRRFFAETDKCNYCSSVPYRHLIMPEFFRLLLSCGLRCSEARLLTVGDVDLGQGVLTIRVIRYRQASDHWNEASYKVNLKLFDRHCHRFSNGAVAELSQEMVDDWCRQRKNEENNSCRSRIYVVVSFIKFLRDRGLTSVCPPEVPRKETRTYIPHAFTDEELTAFFQECDKVPVRKNNLQDACRRLTVPVFFRLPYSSGIRTNEARLLECRDVDLVNSVINVRYSKGHDQHYIVLHDTMLELMKKYNEAMSLLVPDRTYFFPSRDGSYYKKRLGNEDFPAALGCCQCLTCHCL